MLFAKNITKKIDGKTILDSVSLSLAEGQIVSVIGPSGSGKTTLLRALALIDPPDSGFLAIDNDTYTFPLPENQSLPLPYPRLTVVFQQFFIWPHVTIRQNLTLPCRKSVDKEHFAEVVDLLQMGPFLDRYPNTVSMGERQRAALARALLLRPKYLLLDEVTSALDVEQSHLILGHLQDIAKNGVGVVLVTHALHLVGKISDQILFFDQGKVVESGAGDVLTKPRTDRLKKFIKAAYQTI